MIKKCLLWVVRIVSLICVIIVASLILYLWNLDSQLNKAHQAKIEYLKAPEVEGREDEPYPRPRKKIYRLPEEYRDMPHIIPPEAYEDITTYLPEHMIDWGPDGPPDKSQQEPESSSEEKERDEEEYTPQGPAVIMQKIHESRDEFARSHGYPIPVRPYGGHIQEIYNILSDKGYDRDKMYGKYESVLEKTWELTEEEMKKTPQTLHVTKLFADGKIDDVNKLIHDRLNKNHDDIPGLLLRHTIHSESGMAEEVFNDMKDIIRALENRDPQGVDPEAIIYHVLSDITQSIAYLTEEELADRKTPGKFTISCHSILHMLELAGDW